MILRLVSTQSEELRKRFVIKKDDAKKSVLNVSNFKSRYLNFTSKTFRDFNELAEHANYDTYVVGSDLVWEPLLNNRETLPVYLLGFANQGCKVSYATSVGEWIPKWARSIFEEYLKKFDFISVRDETSAKSLREFSAADIEVVLDPVSLLGKEEWARLLKPPEKKPRTPYVLIYDIRRFTEIQSEMKRIAREMEWNLVTYVPSKDSFSFYSFDPLEFLWLYENAHFVVSSSFHGTVFAVLFNKPFYAVSPGPHVFPYRVKDFLRKLCLEDRFVENPRELESLSFDEPNWSFVNTRLENERKRSLDFLKKALEGVEK